MVKERVNSFIGEQMRLLPSSITYFRGFTIVSSRQVAQKCFIIIHILFKNQLLSKEKSTHTFKSFMLKMPCSTTYRTFVYHFTHLFWYSTPVNVICLMTHKWKRRAITYKHICFLYSITFFKKRQGQEGVRKTN